ncbi:MAG TPA: DUF6152 family protein [Gammaproteobacteria bacterium]
MRPSIALLTLAASSLLSSGQANAHHSYAATYDVSRTVRLEGRLVRFEYRSPHSYLHLVVKGEDGETQRWAVEWAAPSSLVRQGVSRDTLRTGDELIVVARPSRAQGEFRSLMLTLERPADGLKWGTNPDEVVD